MASRESLKGNEIGIQPVQKKTLSSPSKNDSDGNLSENVIFRASNVLDNEAENANFSPASLLLPLTRRSTPQVHEAVKTSPPATSAPFGPTILDKLITKNKLQSMKEAELRKDKTSQNDSSESCSLAGDPKVGVDSRVLKKRKMIANRLRNHPFLTKKRRKLKKKMSSQLEAAKQGSSKVQKNPSPENANTSNSKKKPLNCLETNKLDSQSSSNRLRGRLSSESGRLNSESGRLNSESSSPSQAKKTLANKNNRPMKSQLRMPNVEALKKNPKLRRSTRSDSPVLRNGKRRKCDELTLDLCDVDRKRKKLVSDLASVKSDGMSDEQCSFVTASESDICSFLDLETNSQNLDASDIKEESSDSTNFKLEIPTSPSVEGDDMNSSSLNLEEPFKGIASNSSFPKVTPKKDPCSSEDESKSDSFIGANSFDSKVASDKLKAGRNLLDFFRTNDKNEESETLEIKENLLHETECKSNESESIKSNFCLKQEAANIVKKKDDDESLDDYIEEEIIEIHEEENQSFAVGSVDDNVSLNNSADLSNSFSVEADTSNIKPSDSALSGSLTVHPQGRKIRSASLNDSSKVGKVSFMKVMQRKIDDEEQNKTSDTDEVSFTADNNQFELFVEQEYKRGRKKRSSSDTSLKRMRNRSVEVTDVLSKSKLGVCPILEDEKSSDANGPSLSSEIYSDEKENELYENDITEESNSEEASCSSSQVSEHPKLNENEFQDLEGKDKLLDGKETDGRQDYNAVEQNEGLIQQMNGDALVVSSNDADKSVSLVTTSETPEAQKMKESILSALGLQSTSMPPSLQKVNKSEDKYTGTLKAVIKLNKKNAGRMVFKQRDTSNAAASKNLEYRICSYAPGSENVPLTHLKDIAVNSIPKKTHSKPKAPFDLSGPLIEEDVDSQTKKDEPAAEGAAPKEGEVKKALIIPEKSSSFSIHPERLCSDVCSYCHGKFGSLDTPCHIGQIKNSERRTKILSIEILLTKDSCLCDACFRYVDRRANCPSFKAQAPKSQKRQPLSGVVCSVQGCTQPANHSVRRKWIVKLKKSIAKKLMIDMDKIQHNQHLPFPLCSQHYYWVDYFTVCGICKKRLSRNNMYALGPEAEELNRFLQEDGIPVHLTDKLFLCKLCRYYSSLRLKYKDLSQLTPGHKTYFRSYRRKILQYHDIEVSESEEDIGGKSAEDESTDNNSGKVRKKKSKKNTSEDVKKSNSSDDRQRPIPISCTSGCSYSVDTLDGDQSLTGGLTPTIDYSALGEPSESIGFNNIASLLTNRNQSEPVGNPSRIQVKFGNLNIAKLNMSDDVKSDQLSSKSLPTRPPYLPGEQDLPLKADISFQTRNKNSAWERCTSTIQFDKDTKQLWQELQRPYGNASSFLRHLVMLEKHWRSGSLVLVENADPRAAKYVSSVRNRVDSFERNFSSAPGEFKAPSKVQSKAPVDISSPCTSTAPRPDTPIPSSLVSNSASETVRSSCSDKQESLVEPSDTSDSISDNLEVKSNEASQVPQMSFSCAVVNSAVTNPTSNTSNTNLNPYDSVNISIGNKASTGTGASISTSTSNFNVSLSNTLNSNSALIQSLNSQPISSVPIVNLLNLNSTNNLTPSFSRSINSIPNVTYATSLSSVARSSPSVSLILPPNMSTALPSSLQNTLINLTSNTDGNSISLNQYNVSAPNSILKPEISVSPSPSLRPNVNIAPKPNPNIAPKPNPNIAPKANPNKLNPNFPPKQNPNTSSKTNPNIPKQNPNTIPNMNPNIAPRPNPNFKQQNVMKIPGAKVLSVGNKLTFVSSPNSSSSSSNNSISNNYNNSNYNSSNYNCNNQFRKNLQSSISSVDAAHLNKANVRKTNSNQGIRQYPKFPPQLLRFPGPNAKSNVPPLELIVPKSFTMQTKPVSSTSTSGQVQSASMKSRGSVPIPTQGIMDNLAYLRQFRSLKPKPPEPSRQSPTASTSSFNPMICDVRSLASSEGDNSTLSSPSNSSMPKIPKALTITQVTQPSVFPRSVTVSLEKKPNQIPAAFLGGEKPSVSVFCEVNPPP